MNPRDAFFGPVVTLSQVLCSREARAMRQKTMLAKTECASLLSFTLAIPGEVKQSPLLQRVFTQGTEQLRLQFEKKIKSELLTQEDTGSELLLALTIPPETAKRAAVEIETNHPLGRLFDLDVLRPDGSSLSRTSVGEAPRRCLLCGQNAKVCARAHAHSAEALRECINERIDTFFRGQAADRFAALATRALLYEVSVTPKPGLVDRQNNGAHTDMDFFTFLDSISVLTPYLRAMVSTGWKHAESDVETLFSALRFVGQNAERAMFAATGGVNTHKGILFSLAVLGGAWGRQQARTGTEPVLDEVLSVCAALGNYALKELPTLSEETHGCRCYHAYGVQGVRGEAARGFPTVVQVGLPALQKARAEGRSQNDAAAVALLALIGAAEDTNLLHRGGAKCAEACRSEAQQLVARGVSLSDIARLDRQYIARNLSPGGCADLLTLTLLLDSLTAPIS